MRALSSQTFMHNEIFVKNCAAHALAMNARNALPAIIAHKVKRTNCTLRAQLHTQLLRTQCSAMHTLRVRHTFNENHIA